MIFLLNKADKLSKNKISQATFSAEKKLERLSTKHYVLATSATNKIGIESLLARINELK